jgi:Zn-dependent protease
MEPPPPPPVFTVEPPGTSRPAPPRANAQGLGGTIVAIALVIWKFGATSLSMLFMIWVYSRLFGWPLAVGVVLLLFVHEMGHFIAAKMLGIPVSAPLFIPFLGATIIMRQNPRDAWTEARMAYAGPLAGGLGGWVCLLAGIQMNWPVMIPIAAFTFFLNLFNLIPIPPMDGGRVCAAVSRWFWILGIVMLGGAVVYFQAWSMAIIAILVLFMAIQRIRADLSQRGSEAMRRYYNLKLGTRALVAACYLGLIVALLIGYDQASKLMPQIRNNGTVQTDQ